MLELKPPHNPLSEVITTHKWTLSFPVPDKSFGALSLSDIALDKFENSEFDICTIFYNQFKNVITQIPQAQQIIPLNNENSEENASDESYEF